MADGKLHSRKDTGYSGTLLITGGAGFIGSCFVINAVKQGYRVVVLDALTYAGKRENIQEVISSEKLHFFVGKIQNTAWVSQLLSDYEVTAVINFAAESHVDRSISSPGLFIDTNVLGTCSLLNASCAYWKKLAESEKKKFRYLQISTDEVYGELETAEGKFSESTALSPNSPYSASKAGADFLVRAWNRTYSLPTLITRCSNNYGPRQFPEKFIPKIISCALSGESIPVYADGANIRDWIHVEDHCRGIFSSLEKGIPGSIYCFGGNSEKSNLQVVNQVCTILDEVCPRSDAKAHSTAIEFVADRLGHDFRYAIDNSFVKKELGWSPKYTFDVGLRETISWYISQLKQIQKRKVA